MIASYYCEACQREWEAGERVGPTKPVWACPECGGHACLGFAPEVKAPRAELPVDPESCRVTELPPVDGERTMKRMNDPVWQKKMKLEMQRRKDEVFGRQNAKRRNILLR